ncbi:MAG: WecB/TagA/CpsF family glycosyltransferase [Lachnospiraceae bacterium]|nr:WecB/TagA/CpsF family glycosyltransferase [Lachnospiraceae bacterium]
MRQIELLGLKLQDYSVREAMRLLHVYVNDDVCNKIDFVTHELLLSASENPELADYIQGADMTVFASSDILEAANMSGRAREREIESNLFLKGMLRKFSKEKRGIYSITSSEEAAEALKTELLGINEGLKFCGGSVAQTVDADMDSIVNDINSVIPDVVVIRLPAGMGEKFMAVNSMKINSRLLVSLGDTELKGLGGGYTGLRSFIIRRLFKREATKYQS